MRWRSDSTWEPVVAASRRSAVYLDDEAAELCRLNGAHERLVATEAKLFPLNGKGDAVRNVYAHKTHFTDRSRFTERPAIDMRPRLRPFRRRKTSRKRVPHLVLVDALALPSLHDDERGAVGGERDTVRELRRSRRRTRTSVTSDEARCEEKKGEGVLFY